MAQQTYRTSIAILAALLLCGWGVAQEQFELFVPSTDVVSTAVRTSGTLRITDSAGGVTVYRREPRYDTIGGDHLAYYSQEARQAILWPRDNRGALQIGEPSRGGSLAFRESQMRIRPTVLAERAGTIDPGIYYRLTSEAGRAARLCLAIDRSGRTAMTPAADVPTQQWQLVEAGEGYYRLQSAGSGRRESLGIDDSSYRPGLQRTTNDIRQLWRLAPVGYRPDVYRLTNAGRDSHGLCLAGDRHGAVTLVPISHREEQFWRFERLTRIPPTVLATQRIASRQLTPNPPLPPARVEMANTHSKELWIVITNLSDPAGSLQLKIPPGQSQTVNLARDAGASLVETYEVATPLGTVRRDEFVTQLPPAVLYDVSVYELILQSVSIDRTVPGGRLDRTNYSPKSVGRFIVPPGAALQDGRSDIYQNARQRNNPGAVRRIDPRQWQDEPEAEHPVDSLLREFQGQGEEIPAPLPRPISEPPQ